MNSDDQTKMTTFQKQVFNFYKVAEQEEQEKRMEQSRGGGGSSRPRNQRKSGGAGDEHSMSETVRYESDNDFSEEESDRNVAEFVDT